jgi:formamidopyrimidine-DNA glycosylase
VIEFPLRRRLCGNEVNVPELPEVETVKRGLEPALVGRRFVRIELRRKDLRFPFPEGLAEAMTGAKVEALERRAKYILVHCSNGKSLILHLGMTGRFTVETAGGDRFEPGAFYHAASGATALGPHDHVVWQMDDGTTVIYNDARRFGFMDWADTNARDQHKLLRDIGVEPLGNSFHAEHLIERFKGKKAPMKAALLDQHVVAGLGNIYVSEALYRAHISPKRAAGKLLKAKGPDPRLGELVRHIKDILNEAIRAGGSTLQDFQGANGEKGTFQQRFLVYDREGERCSTTGCESVIKRIVQSGRSSFFCPTCQK